MTIRVGINGFGRIGRNVLRAIIESKRKDIKVKTNININIIAISAKRISKKRSFKIKKNIFYKNPIDIVKNPRVNIVFELIGYSDGISKKVVEIA